MLGSLDKPRRSLPLFEDSLRRAAPVARLAERREGSGGEQWGPEGEIQELELELEGQLPGNESEWDFYGTYEVDSTRFKAVGREATHQFDVDNLFFDPNQFSIVNSISNSSANKRLLLEEFPELKTLINNDLGFALQKKK